jgi:tRNA-guanine family transglycosylase
VKPQYFLPWWSSDYIWQEWQITDDLNKSPDWKKVYLWDLMPGLLDGILISRMAISPRRIANFRQDFRFDGIILGDSGAHSYRALDEPPFSCENLLQFYDQGQFNYGMTLDMVASPWVRPGGLSDMELKQRLKTTLENAEKCLEIHAHQRYTFELLGVVQGWDAASYRRCAKALLKLGFNYLAIAGQRNLTLLKDAISAVLEEIKATKRSVKIHILGTGSAKMLSFYLEQGITSFDSATWFRQAWMSGTHNYFVSEGKQHKAYRATRIGLGELHIAELTWETEITCSCPVCETVGQQILLFRGHERNTRRGFHNVYQYIQLLNSHRFTP